MKKHLVAALLAAFLPAMSTLTFAHGEPNDKKKPVAVKKEQKPWGIAGEASSVKRSITVAMLDTMRFAPERFEVKEGETIRFVLKNQGKILHEMVIGTKGKLDEHAALMLKFPDMEHDEPYMAHVPAGKSGEIIWTFNRAGDFEFACLIAGHYQAGMKGKIMVIGK